MLGRLKKNERCPIHKSFFCCGREKSSFRKREQKRGWTRVAPGVWRIEDEHHPRGYRERRNATAMKALVMRKVEEQDNCCSICDKEFTDWREIVPDHKDPRCADGAWRDDHPDNIGAAHAICNGEKGSRRDYVPAVAGREIGEAG